MPATRYSNKQYAPWFVRRRPTCKKPQPPWFILPMFNNLHPLEVLKARLRHWESVDQQYAKSHPAEREQLDRGLENLPDDLRWLASRLEVLMSQGYKPVAD